MKVGRMTDKAMAYNNCVYMNPVDLDQMQIRDNDLVTIDEVLVHRVRGDPQLSQGTIGTSNLQWNALHLDKNKAIGATVTVEPWDTCKQNRKQIANTVSYVVKPLLFCVLFLCAHASKC